jgi:hypothetical protein
MPLNDEEQYYEYLHDQAAKLPFPLAEALNLFCRTDDPTMKFRNLIRVGTVYIKWLSLISIANYVQNNLENNRINETLGGREFARPSLGNYYGLLTAILPLFKKFPDRFKPLGLFPLLLKPRGKPKPILINLDQIFLKLRNLYVHPDITPSKGVAKTLLEKNIGNLYSLVKTFEIFTTGDLLLRRDGQSFYSLTGFDPKEFKSYSGQLEADGICGYKHDGKHLPLYPFVHPGEPETDAETNNWSVFLYESLLKKYVKYTNSSNLLLEESVVTHFKELQKKFNVKKEQKQKEQILLLKKGLIGSLDWEILRNYSEEKSLDLVDQHRRSLKYHQDLYYSRKEEGIIFKDFFSGNDTCLFVVSQTGSGKTNLLCHLTRKRLKEGDVLLHYYGRNFEGQSLKQLLEESLHLSQGQFDSFFKSLSEVSELGHGKYFVIIFDAINEYQNPLELFKKILDFIKPRCRPWLKVIISCRPLAWKQIEAHVSWDDIPIFTVKQPDGTPQAYLNLKQFSETEVEQVFNLYKNIKDGDKRFGIIINEEFKNISKQVRQLICNPALLRFLCITYEKVPASLFGPEIIWKYFRYSIPERHHPFLSLFVDLLWELKTDYLSEEHLTRHIKEGNVRATKKLLEYVSEGRIEAVLEGYRCSRSECSAYKWFIDPALLDGDRCPECERKSLQKTKQKVMNTFDFLLDEGVIIEYESPSTRIFRFLYDRFFEAMMGRKIYSETVTKKDQVEYLFEQIEREASSLVLYEALKNCLLLLVLKGEKHEHDKLDTAVIALPEVFICLCDRLIDQGSAHSANIVESTLIEIGRIERFIPPLIDYLDHLASKDLARGKTGPSLRFALDITAQLGFQEVILRAIERGNAETRLLAAIHIYRLWRNYPEVAFLLLRTLEDKLFFIGVPRVRIFEPLGISSIAIFFDGFRDPASLSNLGDIWKRLVSRLKRNPLVGIMVTFLMLKYFSKIPLDYNPANWFEYRDNHRFIRKNKRVNEILSEQLKYFDPEYGTMAEFRELSLELAALDEGTTASWSFFLLLAIARYHLYTDEVFETALEYARIAYKQGKSGHHLATMSTVWSQLAGEVDLSSGQYERLKTDEERRILENMGRCKSLKREYHFTIILEYMRLVHNNSGTMKIPFIETLVDELLKQNRTGDLLWVVRNLEVLGIELGTFSETDKWLALFALVDVLQKPVPENVRRRCIDVLAKANLFFASDVRRLIETIEDRGQRTRLLEEMARVRARIHVGELMSSKPFAYWIHVVKTPGLREHWQEIYRIFLKSYSPLSWGRAVYKHVRKLIAGDN